VPTSPLVASWRCQLDLGVGNMQCISPGSFLALPTCSWHWQRACISPGGFLALPTCSSSWQRAMFFSGGFLALPLIWASISCSIIDYYISLESSGCLLSNAVESAPFEALKLKIYSMEGEEVSWPYYRLIPCSSMYFRG